MKYIDKLKNKGVTAPEFAKAMGKEKRWGYSIYAGINSKGDEFLLHPRYYEAVMQHFKFIRKSDFL